MIREVLIVVIVCLVAVGWAYWMAAWVLTRAFLARAAREAAGSTDTRLLSVSSPRISILKPVKGEEPETFENLSSFCRQDFPSYEILFGVADAADPAVALIHRLQATFPDTPIRLLVGCEPALNPKCAILRRLEKEAAGDVLVLSDDDIRVGPDYLARVVAPLSDPSIGWVTCPYRGLNPRSFAGRLAALHMDVVFLPAVVIADAMGQRVGMGATLALRRTDLARAGGIAAIADHLMDDYQLASILAGLGLRGRLSGHVVGSTVRTTFAQQWGREIRWARGIRVTCPGKYWGLLLTYPLVWAVALTLAARFNRFSLIVIGATLLLRWMIAWDIQRRIHAKVRWELLYLPIREILSFFTWCGGIGGRHIEWRGEHFFLSRDGKLSRGRGAGPIARGFVRAVARVDSILRRRQGIFEYDDRATCVLRVSLGVCKQEAHLSDGTALTPGDSVCELHLYNEHIPPIGPAGPDIAWAKLAHERVRQSLASLAEVIAADRRFEAIKALYGQSSFMLRRDSGQLKRMARRLHFDVAEPAEKETFLKRLHHLGEDLLIWALARAFNPAALRGATVRRARHLLFISRDQLMKHYLPRRVG